MKILVATPAFGAQVYTGYLESIIKLIYHFERNHPGIELVFRNVTASLITVSRNLYASMILNDESYTHLLFIDADMGFDPSTIERMIGFDSPVVGTIYPYKDFDFEKYHQMRQTIDNPILARVVTQGYVGGSATNAYLPYDTHKGDQIKKSEFSWRDGFLRVKIAGTGIMLIKREVFHTMKDKFPELYIAECGEHYKAFGLQGGVLQCFEAMQDTNGLFLGEDSAFCKRWTNTCGGEIWALADCSIAHVGNIPFVGNYAAKYNAGHM